MVKIIFRAWQVSRRPSECGLLADAVTAGSRSPGSTRRPGCDAGLEAAETLIRAGTLKLGGGMLESCWLPIACAAAAVVSPVRERRCRDARLVSRALHLVDRGEVEGQKPLRHERKTAQLLLGVPRALALTMRKTPGPWLRR